MKKVVVVAVMFMFACGITPLAMAQDPVKPATEQTECDSAKDQPQTEEKSKSDEPKSETPVQEDAAKTDSIG